jgi:hypothetical protein
MAEGIFALVIFGGMLVAGVSYIRTAHRMRTFATTRGRIVGREVVDDINFDNQEAVFGDGGGFTPKYTYTYAVGATTYTGDKLGYATRGYRKRLVEQKLAAMPDEVDVHYDPANPRDAYLELNTPTMGWWFIAGGTLGVLVVVVALLG